MDASRRKLRPICHFFTLTRRQKKNIRFPFYIIFLTVAFLRIFYYVKEKDVRAVEVTSPEASQLNREEQEETKLVLVYTPNTHEPWGPKTSEEAESYIFSDWDGTPCEESRCQITLDRNLLNISDAVLVHAITLPRKLNIEEITRNRPSAQRWVFYVKESPGVLLMGSRFDGIFNWTATYRRDSDFFVPYGSYASLKDGKPAGADTTEDKRPKTADVSETQRKAGVNYAQGKDKMAAFGVSNNCGGPRFAFIRALMKHVEVNIFGKCATQFELNKTWVCPQNMGNGCLQELQRHKFYLAFENSLCIDYITEKYWRNSLERGLVPIVLGGASYSPELVIPGSFINAADFDSVKALADYLKYLDKNDTAYNQYFQWKTKYKVVKYQFWLCQLCKALHDPTKPTKIYHKILEFWGAKESCAIDKERIWDIINRG